MLRRSVSTARTSSLLSLSAAAQAVASSSSTTTPIRTPVSIPILPIPIRTQLQYQRNGCSVRGYISRAHPPLIKPLSLGLYSAIQTVLEEAHIRQHVRKAQRKDRILRKQQSEQPQSLSTSTQGTITTSTACGHIVPALDETIEVAVNLNLDPRKPGQALRGSLTLPHGSGEAVHCLVFTGDAVLAQSLQQQYYNSSKSIKIGGEDLIEQLGKGQIAVDHFHRGLATSDIMPLVTRKLARLLGPRGLMPNAKTQTVFDIHHDHHPDLLQQALQTYASGSTIQYRTDREGIVHARMGRASFDTHALVANIGTLMKEIFDVKPDTYGKSTNKNKKSKKNTGGGKKSGSSKNTRYLLGVSVSSTQGRGYKVDLRTVDPTTPFFLSTIEGEDLSMMNPAATANSAKKKNNSDNSKNIEPNEEEPNEEDKDITTTTTTANSSNDDEGFSNTDIYTHLNTDKESITVINDCSNNNTHTPEKEDTKDDGNSPTGTSSI